MARAIEPNSFHRRVLLAAVGLTPQVITETVYALAVAREPPFVPNEIHVVTTTEGKARVELMLLDPSMAKLRSLAEDFGLPDVAGSLKPSHIHVIGAADDRPLSDISSEADNARTADLINQLVRELTGDPGVALHVSIAGGRKTMGFLLGHSLSLFGRPQDRLSHVLVDQPFEQHPDFFYPPKVPRVLFTRENRPVNTVDARLVLADIPFVRLRQGMPEGLLEGRWTYSETVERAQQSVVEPALVIDSERRTISCHGVPIQLQHVPFALYAWLARRRMERRGGNGATHWSEADPRELLAEYDRIGDVTPTMIEAQAQHVKDGIPSDKVEQNRSRIRSVLKERLGPMAEHYDVKTLRRPEGSHYAPFGLTIDPDAIQFGAIETTECDAAY